MAFRQVILGTALGRTCMGLRDKARTLAIAIRHPEQLGTATNDQLAFTLVTRLCEPGRTFLDVGAHIGSVMSEARNCTSCKVVAVEAMADKAAALNKKFPDATVYACAVGENEGEASFYVDTVHSGHSSLKPHRKDAVHIKVPVRTLDSLVMNEDVDVVKIDVEGAELDVLRGSVALVARCRPVVMFESGPDDMSGKLELWRWFTDRNYALFVPNRVAHHGPSLTANGFEESHWYPRRATNYFAIPAERIAVVRERARRILGVSE